MFSCFKRCLYGQLPIAEVVEATPPPVQSVEYDDELQEEACAKARVKTNPDHNDKQFGTFKELLDAMSQEMTEAIKQFAIDYVEKFVPDIKEEMKETNLRGSKWTTFRFEIPEKQDINGTIVTTSRLYKNIHDHGIPHLREIFEREGIRVTDNVKKPYESLSIALEW